MQFPKATTLLRRRLGAKAVLTDSASLEAYSYDSLKIAFPPEAVIRAGRVSDVGAALKLANRHRVPVTVRGRGTSLTGSAAPARGGWVLDLLGLDQIRIDAESGLAWVQAGARVADIQRAAEAAGWFYPPDPSSREHCTIGGNIACNAGGMHGAKYGVTRDYILALEGYLPTGEFVRWGTPTRKFSSGFNLRDLWIGSEGMLGVVTQAVLKLVPLPPVRWTLLATFEDEAAAFRAVRGLFAGKVVPAICEFLDRYSVGCAERATGRKLFAGQSGRPLVLLELSGTAASVRDEKRRVLAWARARSTAWREARTREQAEQLWSVRRKCSSAMFEAGDAKLNEDVVLPSAKYEAFARFLEALRRSSKLSIPTFGHLGDGNLHVNIMYRSADPAQSRRAVAALKRLMSEVVRLGGAISGEHGIGLAKTPFLRVQHPPAQVNAMLAVKRALDPNGVLNPGKMFEDFRVWEHPRVKVKLPWDHK